MNGLRRPVAPAVRLPDRDPPAPLGASPPGPPVASPILPGATTSVEMRPASPTLARSAGLPALLLTAGLALVACGHREPPLFEMLPPERTGVTFTNPLHDDTAFNNLPYMYFYDGGRVPASVVNPSGPP